MMRTIRSAGTLVLALGLGLALVAPASAQDASPVGDWEGALSAPGVEYPLVLHVTADEDGALSATLDSPSQGAFGIPAGEVTFADGVLTITFPDLPGGGGYEGTISEDGNGLTGTWSQGGMSLELSFTRSEG